MVAVLLLCISGTQAVQAEDASGTVRKRGDNLNFQVPPDWPIEKRNGIMGPIPIEEYLARKFSALEQRLQSLEQRVSGFDIRLRNLEAQNQKTQSLTSTGAQ